MENLLKDMQGLLESQKSLVISSLSKDGSPEISYAPFVMMNNKIYLYLSRAANHYYNLRDNRKCSVMAIEDESKCNTIFARGRLTFVCEANMMENVSEEIFNKFDENHSEKMMSMFKKMDFNMFELDIKSGRLVQGFGKAYDIEFINGEPKFTQSTGAGNGHGGHGHGHTAE